MTAWWHRLLTKQVIVYIEGFTVSTWWCAGWQKELGFASMLKLADEWDGSVSMRIETLYLPPKVLRYTVKTLTITRFENHTTSCGLIHPTWQDYKNHVGQMAVCLTFLPCKPNNKVKCKPYNKMNQGQQCSYAFKLWENIYRVAHTCTLSRRLPATKITPIQYSGHTRGISSQWNESLLGAILFVHSTYSRAFDVITSFK